MQITLKASSEDSQKVEVAITDEGFSNENFVDLLITDLETQKTIDTRVSVAEMYAALRVFEDRRTEALEERQHHDLVESNKRGN
jgi:hypothetical protein